MKRRIEPLVASHHCGKRNDQDEPSRTVASRLAPEQKAKMPLVTHSPVRRHPVTGAAGTTPTATAAMMRRAAAPDSHRAGA